MNVAIVGLGLIGGSLAISLKESGFARRVVGVESSARHAEKALSLQLVEAVLPLGEAIREADIIIIATPVDALLTLLPAVLDQVDGQIVIEVGSTKKPVVDCVRNHPKRRNYVATHPMAGTEYSGPEAAVPNLFSGKCSVFCDVEDSDPAAVEAIKRMYEDALQMRVVFLESASHDVHTAYISHISHICSFALALTVLDKEKEEARIFELASGGFSSTVRLAKSSPDTWIPIFRQNRDNVLDVLDEYITTLLKFKGLMLSDSYEVLRKQLEHANDIRRILE